jgi:hypothetical protein
MVWCLVKHTDFAFTSQSWNFNLCSGATRSEFSWFKDLQNSAGCASHYTVQIKCKVKAVSVLNEAPRHEDAWWSGGKAPRFLNFYTKLLSASRPGSFNLTKVPRVPTGYEAVLAPQPLWTWWLKKSLHRPWTESNPGRPARNTHYTDWATPALYSIIHPIHSLIITSVC